MHPGKLVVGRKASGRRREGRSVCVCRSGGGWGVQADMHTILTKVLILYFTIIAELFGRKLFLLVGFRFCFSFFWWIWLVTVC